MLVEAVLCTNFVKRITLPELVLISLISYFSSSFCVICLKIWLNWSLFLQFPSFAVEEPEKTQSDHDKSNTFQSIYPIYILVSNSYFYRHCSIVFFPAKWQNSKVVTAVTFLFASLNRYDPGIMRKIPLEKTCHSKLDCLVQGL